MNVKETSVSARGIAISYLAVLNAIFLETAYTSNKNWYWALTVTLPLLLWAIIARKQSYGTRSANNKEIEATGDLHKFGALVGSRTTAN